MASRMVPQEPSAGFWASFPNRRSRPAPTHCWIDGENMGPTSPCRKRADISRIALHGV
jgi:hypothetical protein